MKAMAQAVVNFFFFFFLMVAVVNFYKHTKPWNPLKTLESCRKPRIYKLREERL